MEIVDTTVQPVKGTPAAGTGDKTTTDGTPASSDKGGTGEETKTAEVNEAQQKLDGLLDDTGFDSIEDLVGALQEGTSLAKALSGKDLNQILQQAEELEQIKSYWAEQEAKKLEAEETPDATIARLKKENQSLKDRQQSEAEALRERQALDADIAKFDTEVTRLVDSQTSIPNDYKPFAKVLLGVDNPMVDVDPHDGKAIRQHAKTLVSMLNDFEQAAIKRYKEGKAKIPVIPNSGATESPVPASGEPKKIKNLREASAAAAEKLIAHFASRK